MASQNSFWMAGGVGTYQLNLTTAWYFDQRANLFTWIFQIKKMEASKKNGHKMHFFLFYELPQD